MTTMSHGAGVVLAWRPLLCVMPAVQLTKPNLFCACATGNKWSV